MPGEQTAIWLEELPPSAALCDGHDALLLDFLTELLAVTARTGDAADNRSAWASCWQRYWGCPGFAILERSEDGNWHPRVKLGGRAVGPWNAAQLDAVLARDQPLIEPACPAPGWSRLSLVIPITQPSCGRPAPSDLVLLLSQRTTTDPIVDTLFPLLPLLAETWAGLERQHRQQGEQSQTQSQLAFLTTLGDADSAAEVWQQLQATLRQLPRVDEVSLHWVSRVDGQEDVLRGAESPVLRTPPNASDHDASAAPLRIPVSGPDHISATLVMDCRRGGDTETGFRKSDSDVAAVDLPTIVTPLLQAAVRRIADIWQTAPRELPGLEQADRVTVAPGWEPVPVGALFSSGERQIASQFQSVTLPVTVFAESGSGAEWFAGLLMQSDHTSGHLRLRRPAARLTAEELAGWLGLNAAESVSFAEWERREQLAGIPLLITGVEHLNIAAQEMLLRFFQQLQQPHDRPRATRRVVLTSQIEVVHGATSATLLPDLVAHLRAVSVAVPPLRHHPETIPARFAALLTARWRSFPGLPPRCTDAAADFLQHYPWPGNLRELIALADTFDARDADRELSPVEIQLRLAQGGPGSSADDMELASLTDATADFQRQHIRRAIQHAAGHMTEAARQLGLHRTNLYRKMHQLGMADEESAPTE